MTSVRSVVRSAALVCLLAAPTALWAQSTIATPQDKLATQFLDMYIISGLGNQLALQNVFGTPISAAQLEAQLASALAIVNLTGSQVSSFPLGSSAGGFNWTFDPVLGVFNRASNSFGPVFAERAMTVGRHKLNVGMNYQRATFDSLQGKSLDGEVKTVVGFTRPGAAVLLEDSLTLKLSTDTIGLFATYGVTNRWDVGVAVPIVRASLDARLATRLGFGTSASSITLRPDVLSTTTATGTASGIGDIVVRTKYKFWNATGGGLAAGLDWRVPTGDEENFLGVAGSQARIYLAASGAAGRVSPHFNVGVTISGESDAAKSDESAVLAPQNEINYAGGIDVAVTPRLTFVGDLVGRTLRDAPILVDTPAIGSFNQFTLSRLGNLNLLLGSAGVKVNAFRSGLISFNLLFPLNDNGLKDNLTWVAGVEFSF